ncbi:hypothetical protein ABE85_02315 [Mitsuaria sp. 7]|nr:hypothetical protein ABE85_02315 [Mitsuaria sp. 7]
MGQSGELQVDFKYADRNTMVQYRTTDGTWTNLGAGRDMMGKSAVITAPPGSTVKFRVNNAGEYFSIGTTQNVDGKDHGKVTATGNGFRLGVDDWKNDDGDFDDLILDLSDPKAKG